MVVVRGVSYNPRHFFIRGYMRAVGAVYACCRCTNEMADKFYENTLKKEDLTILRNAVRARMLNIGHGHGLAAAGAGDGFRDE